MSGVIAAMRRTLLSCTSLVRDGLVGLGASVVWATSTARAAAALPDSNFADYFELDRQEIAALTMALAVLGFSVVATILLMRTRIRAARTEARLRSDLHGLQIEADRFRALLFAEPQVLISWAAGDDRPEIAGDIALLMPQEAQQQPQRILAFGTWLPPEPALQMDHAVDALREAGEGFLLNLSTPNGRSIEAMGRAIGGQAIVRIRELGGVRRELAESSLRYRTLLEETELLRDFAAAKPRRVSVSSASWRCRSVISASSRRSPLSSRIRTMAWPPMARPMASIARPVDVVRLSRKPSPASSSASTA